jgi:hypothetical protein
MLASDAAKQRPRRTIGLTLLSIIFGLLSASAFREIAVYLLSASGDPPALFALQLVTAATALTSAAGIWRRTPWAPLAILAYGVVAASLVVLLGPLLDLDAEARSGLLGGAAGIMAFVLLSAWYVRRVSSRGRVSEFEAGSRPD